MSAKRISKLENETSYEPGPNGHDALVSVTAEYASSISRELVVASFIDSLSSRTLHRRAVLGSYAVARHLMKHEIEKKVYNVPGVGKKEKGPCLYCGEYDSGGVDEDYIASVNSLRHSVGGLNFTSLEDTCVHLRFFLEEAETDFNLEGFSNLSRFLEIANGLPAMATLTDLVKSTKDALASTTNERRSLIENLGACGVLQSKDHPSFFNEFIPYEVRLERWMTRHNNDWQYPVQWWRGRDGVDSKAVRFWFPELEWKT